MKTNASDTNMAVKPAAEKKRNIAATTLAFVGVGGLTWLFLTGAFFPSKPELEQYDVETATNRQVTISEVNQVGHVSVVTTTISETTPHGWFHDFGAAIAASLTGAKLSTSAASTAAPGPNEVYVRSRMFTPSSLTVPAGTTITWLSKNDVETHTIVSDRGIFSLALNVGGTTTFTFTEPGTYAYHCTPHPEMTGTVIVTAAAAPAPAVPAPVSTGNGTVPATPSPTPGGTPVITPPAPEPPAGGAYPHGYVSE